MKVSPPEDLRCCDCATTTEELRPYGPEGAWICFACAMGTPDRKSIAEAALGAKLDAIEVAGEVALIGVGVEGPVGIPRHLAERVIVVEVGPRRPKGS